jgi:hypothetical protein
MFLPIIQQWLDSNKHPSYASYLLANRSAVEAELTQLGLDLNSEIAYLYLNYGSGSVRGWYELNEIEQIRSATTYAHLELDVPENFLALTSIEGQGITLFDKESGAIFDVEFGEFEELTSGKLLPIANSVSEFLLWCKNREMRNQLLVKKLAINYY